MPPTSAEYLLDDHPRTLFPLDLTRIVIEQGSPRVHQYLKEEIKPRQKSGQSFSPQLHCYSAKHGLHLRRTLKLDPAAELFALDRFEQALNQKHNGRAAHVGARAELEAVTAEVMLIVRQLDALNRFRFRSDAESLAGWKSARDVAWPAPPIGEAEKPAA
jgi:hypothetical protein